MNTRAVLLATAVLLAAAAALAQQQPRPGAQQKGKRTGDLRARDTLRVGDTAPDFKLKTRDGDRDVQLAVFRGKRPVVLVFGSYT